jgi:hypothetical protein
MPITVFPLFFVKKEWDYGKVSNFRRQRHVRTGEG